MHACKPCRLVVLATLDVYRLMQLTPPGPGVGMHNRKHCSIVDCSPSDTVDAAAVHANLVPSGLSIKSGFFLFCLLACHAQTAFVPPEHTRQHAHHTQPCIYTPPFTCIHIVAIRPSLLMIYFLFLPLLLPSFCFWPCFFMPPAFMAFGFTRITPALNP